MRHFDVEKFLQEKMHWILKKKEFFKKRHGIQILKSDPKSYRENKKQALAIVQEKIKKFNAVYQLTFARISIRNQKSRWGSCSRRKNLNFNVRIALIPEYLAEYIVVHELCHLKELNHSRAFWELVSHTIPDYLSHRKELKKFSLTVY
ncbi:M48 family metallopeptidase [Candidatus Uhrbacteria bacterium]|nr:M48 family metallopeptidase [Candidatus Uhrbacteria bacterium]